VGLVFDLAELINILTETVSGEAASSAHSKLTDATLRRSLKRRFRRIADKEIPETPTVLRRVISSSDYIKLICGDNLRTDFAARLNDEIREATAALDGATLSRLETRLGEEAIRVIAGSLSIQEQLMLRSILAIGGKVGALPEYAGRTPLEPALGSSRSPVPSQGWAGHLSVPPLPDPFLGRPEIQDRVLALLLGPEDRPAPIVAMAGMGGSGKTVLARAVALDAAIGARFPGGVLWLDVGDTPEGLCQAAILGAAGAGAGDSVAAGRTALRQRLSGTRCLLVLDDVTRAEQIMALDVLDPGSALLVTTRDQDTLLHGTLTCLVDAFDLGHPGEHADAMSLLTNYTGAAGDVSPADIPLAEETVARCGGLPLALAICGAMVADGYPWQAVVDLLRAADLASLEKAFRGYPHPSLLAAIAVGTASLDANPLALYEDLAVFSSRGRVPVAAAARLWRRRGLGADESRRVVIRLGRRSLLHRPADATFRLHDLQYDYLRWRAGDRLPDLHLRLAESYLAGWGGIPAGLPAIELDTADDDDHRYGISYLVDHLVQAGRDDLAHELLAAESRPEPGESGNRWFDVHDRIGWLAEYFADIDLARARAEDSTDQAATPADRARSIGREIRYALMKSSLTSIAGSVPPLILAMLVRRGVWSFEKARAYATVIPDAEDQARALTLLARFLAEGTSERAELLNLARRAASRIGYSQLRATAYARIAIASPEPDRASLFDQALEAADAFHQRSRLRVRILLWLAPYYPDRAVDELRRGAASDRAGDEYSRGMAAALDKLPELRDDVLAWARHAHFRGDRGDAYWSLLRCTAPEQRQPLIDEVLAATPDSAKKWHEEELAAALAPYLPAEQLPAFLRGIIDQASPHTTIRALAGALPRLGAEQLAGPLAAAAAAVRAVGPRANRQDLLALLSAMPEPERVGLIEEVADASQQADPASTEWMLCALAPILPEHLLRRAVDSADDVDRAGALKDLAPYLTRDLLRRALSGQSLDSAEPWARAFVHLAPALPAASIRQIVELVATVPKQADQLELLSQLTPCLPPDLVGLAAEIVQTAEPAGLETRAQLLAALAARANQPQRTILYRRALDTAESADYPHHRFRPLTEMASDPEQLIDVLRLQSALDKWSERHWQAGLPSMALPAPVLTRAADIARTIDEPCSRARALAMLVPHVTESERPGLLREVAAAGFPPHEHPDDIPCGALEYLLAEAVRAVPAAARLPIADGLARDLVEENHPDRLRQLNWLAVYLGDNFSDDLQGQAVQCAVKLTGSDEPPWVQRHGVREFTRLIPHLSASRLLEATRIVPALDTSSDPADIGRASLRHWTPYWRTAVADASAAGRAKLLYLIAKLPLDPSEDQLDDELSQIAGHVAEALLETRRWWP